MFVRRELQTDVGAVRTLFTRVYSTPELLDALRAREAWLPALSLVALGSDGEVVGHVAATRGWIGSAPTLALVLPSIDPDQRGQGMGQALMHTLLGAADALNESLAGLVAYPPAYFVRFGFRPAEEYSIAAPVNDWQPSFLVRALTAYEVGVRGTFTFPEPFLAQSAA